MVLHATPCYAGPVRQTSPMDWPPHIRCRRGAQGREENCSAGGGGGGRRPNFPNPPPPSLAAVMGGGVQGGRARPAVPGGGGVNPTSMAQNDTHVALIILTTQMWGGGNYWWKKLFRAKICVPAPLAPTSVLTQNKGPDREPHFSNPPPSFGGRPSPGVHAPPPPPPPPPRRAIFRSPGPGPHLRQLPGAQAVLHRGLVEVVLLREAVQVVR